MSSRDPQRRIVLGLDGSAGAQRARDWCATYAPLLDAEVIGVHALNPAVFLPAPDTLAAPAVLDDVRAGLREALEEWIAPLRAADVPCRTLLVDGSPAGALNNAADAEGADLIVVGRRGSGGFAGLLMGSVPHALSHHARRTLVVVPADAPEHP